MRRRLRRDVGWVCATIGVLICSAVAMQIVADAATAPRRPVTPIPHLAIPAATVPASQPALETIPPAVLQQMYQRELGPRYKPADAGKLYETHQLIEQYFETSSATRKAVVAKIVALGLDPNIVGRLVRLRMHWPALDAGVYYVNEKIGPHQVNYFLGLPPGYDRTRAWPLVIKLPTANAFLTDPMPDGEKVAEIYSEWLKEELQLHKDAIVLMPLLNLTELYGPSYDGMNSVIQPMLHAAGRVNIDPARVYMVGHSMSAHATWNLALHYTTYFAAINPMAGGASADWQRTRLVNLRNVLPIVWHDAGDTIVKVELSRSIVKVMRSLKLDVEYEETKNLGHAPDAGTIERLYGKMRARTREVYPTQVSIQSSRPDTMFNRVDWLQMWQPVSTGKERNVLLKRGTGRMTLYEATFRADAERKNNRFDLTTQNLDSFRIYLNDQMVDFSKAVTVVVNKKARYEGIVKMSVDEMLKDQIFLGRGWRYFTAAIDIDLVERPVTRPTGKPTTATAAPTTRKGTITVGPSRD